MDIYNKKNVVFAGGGIYGYKMVGSLCAIQNYADEMGFPNFFQDKIVSATGTSIGAILALLTICGIPPRKMMEEIHKYDRQSVFTKSDPLKFFEWKGLNCHEYLKKFTSQFFTRKFNRSNFTFQELYSLTGKRLVICVYNVSKKRIEYMDHRSAAHLNVDIALKMSTAVPFIFTPVSHDDCFYVDGGMKCNFPIDVYNDKSSVIGFQLINGTKSKDYFSLLYDAIWNEDNVSNESDALIIDIHKTDKLPFYAFWIKETECQELFLQGLEAAYETIEAGFWRKMKIVHFAVLVYLYGVERRHIQNETSFQKICKIHKAISDLGRIYSQENFF